MELEAVQAYLARLYTDRGVRQHFFADPVAAAMAAGVQPADATMLAQISPVQVRRFAHSLQRKRLNEVRKLLPATCAALGDRLLPLFFGHADTFVPTGRDKYQADARAFCAYLSRRFRADDLAPRWIGEVVRYEEGWLMAAGRSRCIQLWSFRYAPLDLLAARGEGNGSIAPPPRPSLVIWWRLVPGHDIRHASWSLPRLAAPPWAAAATWSCRLWAWAH